MNFPFRERLPAHSNAIVLPQMVLHLEERHAILMHVDCADDDPWLVAHLLETVIL